MKKKKIIIFACAVILALATLGSILAVTAYKKHIAPIKTSFFDRPDSIIIHYVTGSEEPVSKELTAQEITLFYQDLKAFWPHGTMSLDHNAFSAQDPLSTRKWDQTEYEAHKHKGAIELHYDRPRKFQMELSGEVYEFAVCDTVIIEFKNDSPSQFYRPGFEITTGYKEKYTSGFTMSFQRDYYNVFFDTFTLLF